MKFNILFGLSGLAMLLVAVLKAAEPATPSAVTYQPRAEEVMYWPMNRCFRWSFVRPGGSKLDYSLQLRQKIFPLLKDEDPKLASSEKPIGVDQSDHVIAAGTYTRTPELQTAHSYSVDLQFIDLNAIGAVSSTPGQTLRVFAGVGDAGLQSSLLPANTVLPAGEFGSFSWNPKGTEWHDDEAYLQTFWVKGEKQFYRYDVVLVRSVSTLPSQLPE